MLNIFPLRINPHLEYEDLAKRYLDNTLGYTYGYLMEDYSNFDPRAIAEMEKDENWLRRTVAGMQAAIIETLKDDSNYKDPQILDLEWETLAIGYTISVKRELKEHEKSVLLHLRDKFTLGLLSSDIFVQYLKELKEEEN